MRHKFLCCAVVASLCALTSVGASAVELVDVNDDATAEAVEVADQANLLPSSMDQMSAEETITREQLCSVAVRVYASVKGVDYDALVEKAGERLNECPFGDTDSDDVKLAWVLGLTNGKDKEGSLFQPEQTASVQLMNTMLYRALDTAGRNVSLSKNQIAELLTSCRDGDSVAEWAREANAYFVLQGVTSLNKKNAIGVKKDATCEKLVVAAYRAAAVGRNDTMESSSGTVRALSTHSGQDRVSWSNCDADSYRVYYYEKKDFSEKPVYIDLVSSGQDTMMESIIPECVQKKVGNWYWSVDAFDCDGRLIGSTKSTTRLRVTKEIKNSVIYRPNKTVSTNTIESVAERGLAFAGESYESRCARIFGTGSTYHRYSSQAEAASHQTTITIPIWKISGGKKVSSSATLTVNSGIASTVKQIFQEIYESKEQFPIKDIGGYNWRGDDSSSEHCLGLAIDINWNENYMCTNSGAALTGSYWRPGEDPYSIAADSDVVAIFNKYGFVWGGTWNSKKDYMHFSYFGT